MSMNVLQKEFEPKYYLDEQGRFIIENYNYAKPFSNFFPGIAGLWGIPMWAFYVNRGQCIASFGIETKDKAIMEFQPANKSYRLTPTHGFRTFIKVDNHFYEPFQIQETESTSKMVMSAEELTLTDHNARHELETTVTYYTIPLENFPALVRKVTIANKGSQQRELEICDGLPILVPYGYSDWLNKNLARTVEAWIQVKQWEQYTPYYQLNVVVDDKPEVRHIDAGNFSIAFVEENNQLKQLPMLVEAAAVFGQATDLSKPLNFLQDNFTVPTRQETSNRTPSAFSYQKQNLAGGESCTFYQIIGQADTLEEWKEIQTKVSQLDFLHQKQQQNQHIIAEIKQNAVTVSSNPRFDQYAKHTFLDNVLRGGMPVSVKTGEGTISFNVYSRKHGDLERDYNHFLVAPTFYSQGNGNYRDVNQNRRCDVWFNADVRESSLVAFLNLVQADGYNPLVVKGTSFIVRDKNKINEFLAKTVEDSFHANLAELIQNGFLPGELLKVILEKKVQLKLPIYDFMGMLLEISTKQELADHGEGFWSDHWTYNIDLIEQYLAIYPEQLKHILFDFKEFTFYRNNHYVLPRDQRYILTERGVRQYASVKEDDEDQDGVILKTKQGEGKIYTTNLLTKFLCLLANKIATLDPSGVGVEMEADKPNWYDALNGLPGLIGSSVSETFEILRYTNFLQESFKKLSLEDKHEIIVFDELATFIGGLTNILQFENDALAYWNKSNDIKEQYRRLIRKGIDGKETKLSIGEIKKFLQSVQNKIKQGIEKARTQDGFLSTYFFHDVTEHELIDKKKANEENPFVRPKAFTINHLPLYLEGYVHALRCSEQHDEAKKMYENVRSSKLFDEKLKMYRVNASLQTESEEIGRCRVFPRGWLENESIWLHMEYKFMLELVRNKLFSEFYDNYQHVLVPFLKPETYGRSTLENSSFIVSSSHEDEKLHGQGFVARLSGSTAEFLHMWLFLNAGQHPFTLDANGQLSLQFQPALKGELFTEQEQIIQLATENFETVQESIPVNAYAFMFLGKTLVVYHNKQRKDTFGANAVQPIQYILTYKSGDKAEYEGVNLTDSAATDVRSGLVSRIDIQLA